jgi:hypothetical protein
MKEMIACNPVVMEPAPKDVIAYLMLFNGVCGIVRCGIVNFVFC